MCVWLGGKKKKKRMTGKLESKKKKKDKSNKPMNWREDAQRESAVDGRSSGSSKSGKKEYYG